MPLFDLHPKESPATLFGREEELAKLSRLINAGRWTAVLGPRMVGKTSLIRAASKGFRRPTVYVSLWGAVGTRGFIDAFVQGLNANRTLLGRIRGRARDLEGLSIGTTGITVVAPKRPLRTVWDLLEIVGSEAGGTIFELDEFQEVSAASGPILKLLANIFNTHSDISFIFTGSKSGLIRTLLDPKPSSPLFGRPPAELTLEAFSPVASLAFLERGFKEYGLSPDRSELESVIGRSLDGLPGWLAIYGNYRAVAGEPPTRAEELTLREGQKVARVQLRHFLQGRSHDNYWAALKALASGAAWTDLVDAVSRKKGSEANQQTIQSMLRALDEAGFLRHDGRTYSLSDPMLRAFIRATPRPP
jgi:AAA+ ATPase superfamily predicted ATPase